MQSLCMLFVAPKDSSPTLRKKRSLPRIGKIRKKKIAGKHEDTSHFCTKKRGFHKNMTIFALIQVSFHTPNKEVRTERTNDL